MSVDRLPRIRRLLHGALARTAMALAIVLHLGVTSVAPLADARAEAVAAGSTMHVEESSSRDCPPSHDHVACPLCRSMHDGALPFARQSALPPERARSQQPDDASSATPRTRLHAPQSSRAPPQR